MPAHAEIELGLSPIALDDERNACIYMLHSSINRREFVRGYFLLLIDHLCDPKQPEILDPGQFLRHGKYIHLCQLMQILLSYNIIKQVLCMDEPIHQFLLRRRQQCAIRRLFLG